MSLYLCLQDIAGLLFAAIRFVRLFLRRFRSALGLAKHLQLLLELGDLTLFGKEKLARLSLCQV